MKYTEDAVQKFNPVLALTALAVASGGFAQSTSTTMDMGGGMSHVDTMGPNGAISSSNCMNMGGGMTSCQTMDMSQPQRTYPTPDMSRPQTNGTALNFIGDLVARSRERSFQKKIQQLLGAGDCIGAATYAHSYRHEALSDQILRSCRSGQPVPHATVVAPDVASMERVAAGAPVTLASMTATSPIAPAPMTLVSARPFARSSLTNEEFFGFTNIVLEHDPDDMVYTVKYLGRTFTTLGRKGLSVAEISRSFNEYWKNDPWIGYTTDAQGVNYSWNIDSLRIFESGFEVWIRKYYNGQQDGKIHQTKILHFINCKMQSIQTFDTVVYNEAGEVASSIDGSGNPSRIVPETVGSALYDEMCHLRP